MKPEISILMPAIRVHNWDRVYRSIEGSTRRSFELLIVSPYPLTPFLQEKRNVKYVKDFGSPVRASCIGAMLCEGRFVFPTHADDAFFIKDSIDNNIDFLLAQGSDIKNVVVCKYSESENLKYPERYHGDEYYKLTTAVPVNKKYIPDHWLIFNSAFWHREYFDTSGGWDCIFEVCPMAHTDLAIRAQKDGAVATLSPYPIAICNHMPGTSGDHAPVHYAQTLIDEPLFKQKYNDGIDHLTIKIDLMNWKNAPIVWNRRFSLLKIEFKKEWFLEWFQSTAIKFCRRLVKTVCKKLLGIDLSAIKKRLLSGKNL